MTVTHFLIQSSSDLIKLKNQIDKFLDRAEANDRESADIEAEKVKKLIRGLAIDIGLHHDFCCEYEGISAEMVTRSFQCRTKATRVLDQALKLKPSCKKAANDVAKFKNKIEQAIDVLEIKPKQLELL